MSLFREGPWVANRFNDSAEAIHIGLLVSRLILFLLYHRDKTQNIFFTLARLSHENVGKHRESIAYNVKDMSSKMIVNLPCLEFDE